MEDDSEMTDYAGTIINTTELGDPLNPVIFDDNNDLVQMSMRQSRIPILDSEHVHSTSHLGQWPTASSSLHAGSGDDGSSSDEERDASPHVLIQPKPRAPNRPRSSLPSGVVYDARMRHHEEYMSSMEDNTPHPENSTRILAIWKTLAQKKLVQHDVYYPHPDPQDHLLARVDARYALKSEICLVHEKQYYRRAKSWQNLTESELVMIGKRDLESIYLHQTTFSVARLAAGGTIEICRQVVAGNLKNGIAVVRPPGHHAEPQVASGFCIFNNVAIAARVCQQHFPATCRKILILDWDVHHGNGIQKAFENDPNVLYISLHVYQNGLFYPGGTYGDENHCGEGPGLGYNVNIPWMTHGMGDGDYLLAFREIVIPIAEEFNPDLVIVAAGFDAAEGDTLGRCHVSPAGYAQMTHSLTKFANGKLVVVLEGGYTLPSIAKSALAVTQVLMDGEVDRAANPDPQPTASGRAVVELVKRKQAKYWKCMYPKPIEPAGSPGARSDRIHDVIREWQAYRFFKDYSMTPLMILRQGVSRTYNSQVLATPGYDQKKPLLVIFHDPPGAETIIDPRNGRLDWHNTFMTDETKAYIEWAINQDFEVIDVNVPKYITGSDDNPDYQDADDEDLKKLWRADLRELSIYLWVNYIQCAETNHVFFLGIGEAHFGVIDLIASQEGSEDYIKHVFTFIEHNHMVAMRRPTDDTINGWFLRHSSVYIEHNHLAWDRPPKKLRRYGNCIRSDKTTMNEMLVQHRSDIQDVLLGETADWRKEQELNKSKASQLGVRTPLIRRGSAQRTGTPVHSEPMDSNNQSRASNGSPVMSGTDAYERVVRSPAKLPQVGMFSTSPRKKL